VDKPPNEAYTDGINRLSPIGRVLAEYSPRASPTNRAAVSPFHALNTHGGKPRGKVKSIEKQEQIKSKSGAWVHAHLRLCLRDALTPGQVRRLIPLSRRQKKESAPQVAEANKVRPTRKRVPRTLLFVPSCFRKDK